MTPKASIFAGVNGAGKTTAYFELVSKQVDLGRRINACEIAWSIGDHKDPATQVRASRIALTLRKMYLKDKSDFNLETTLCGSGILRLFDELKENGFFICLYFVGLESKELAKERVKIRVTKGGHDIKANLIERRFYESLKNLTKVLSLCDEARIYDNSDTFKLVAQIKNSKILEFKQTKWLKELNI